MALTAFVQAQPALGKATVLSQVVSPPTALGASALLTPAAQSACISFFEGIKIPATLLAGSSFVALFSMTEHTKETYGMFKMQIFLLRMYHVLSLLSFCLSLISVLTAQSATTLLLLGENHKLATEGMNVYEFLGSKGMDAFEFLSSTMKFEFLVTRWSFFSSFLCFMCSTTLRMIVEFALFTKTRRLAGTMVVSWMAGIIGSGISYVNSAHASKLTYWSMTKDVAVVSPTTRVNPKRSATCDFDSPFTLLCRTHKRQMLWNRAYVSRFPFQIAAMTSFAIAVVTFLVFLLPQSVEHDQLSDLDRYT